MNKVFWMGGGGSSWAGEQSARGQKLSAGRTASNWDKTFQTSSRLSLGDISFDDWETKVKRGYKTSIKNAVESKWNSNAGFKKHISTQKKDTTIKFLQKKYLQKVSYNRGKSDYW